MSSLLPYAPSCLLGQGMSYATFGRAHKPVCHFKLAGHPARVCRHLAELATQVWPAERPSGTIELPATPHIMHHAPCTMHHAPPHSVLHRTRCAMHHWRISPCARHCALCTTHPSAYHILDGAVHCTPFTMHHHHASSQSSPGHRYTVLVCMSGTMPYPNGMIARACA